MKGLTKFLVHTALLMGISISAAFAQVATLVELKGAAQAIPAVGSPRDLRMGDALNQGETIATKAMTSAVIRFEDGQVVALTQNSRFAITNYTYNKMEPAKSSILLTLLDGGMRTVTGLIGKAKPDNVTYKAANATIGIRGTDVVFVINGVNLVISVADGKVSFRVGSGSSVTIDAGNGARVKTDAQGAPILVIPTSVLFAANAAASKTGDEALIEATHELNNLPLNALSTGNPATSGDARVTATLGRGSSEFQRQSSGTTSIGGGQNCSQTPKPSGC